MSAELIACHAEIHKDTTIVYIWQDGCPLCLALEEKEELEKELKMAEDEKGDVAELRRSLFEAQSLIRLVKNSLDDLIVKSTYTNKEIVRWEGSHDS